MPNERRRRPSARRAGLLPRLRGAPVFFLGFLVVAVVGLTPRADLPVHWTVRDASGWMAEFEPLRDQRSALIAAASTAAATRGDRLAAAPAAPAPQASAGATPAPAEAAMPPIVVAQADLPPRDEPKHVPATVADPTSTGALPGVSRPTVVPVEVAPTVNRAGKGDRLFSPQPVGRTTDRDLFVAPTLATVLPSQEGWPPLTTIASLVAPQSAAVLPRLALAAPPKDEVDHIVVAMTRTGPGRVVTRSAIAMLGDRDKARGQLAGRPLLPPVPEAQVAAVNPRTTVWTAPAVPELGYARRATDRILARFRAVLGDEEETAATPAVPSEATVP